MFVEVVEPGLATTVQDLGRTGAYNVGIPPSGALDQRSARIANLLVGNPETAALLEAPYLAPKLSFDGPAVVAVTGASAQVLVNGEERPSWSAVRVDAGDVLSLGFVTAGARVYIAVAGGIDVPAVLGSRSTYVLGGLGGHDGRALVAGDRLPVGEAGGVPAGDQLLRTLPERYLPTWSREVDLRVVLGLYDYRLSAHSRDLLVESDWRLTPVADRTGFRYQGPQLDFIEREQPFGAGSDPSNIVDAGYPIGSIQVPSGSEPIVLHRDAVSGGGYAQIGTVISVDLDLVGQCAPGTVTRLVPVTLDDALKARAQARENLDEVRAVLAD
ncbi:biotin-dependent carboxyltransferase family protein [Nocardioides kongjuensis]|uniref:Biotin-dependent carboxylase-like uncharacterized protein n=1 Tax=Nocardioides kongjuensis TaxID=349522 RepID=A0A852RRF4_9ACTN|nr:biotin-dependent carboxyltransferase family protein [Nocardioides kongjuensis]NYD33279.1 biotin-dependent carboxylase-like uncharacterized protein [Nocardioides kongjuensis]